MKKKGIFYRIKGPQLFMSLIFVGLGLIMLVLSVRGYKEYSQKDIVALDSGSISETRVTMDELRSMFEFSHGSGENHELIARKNLFTPDREAWQSPPSNEEEEETVSASSLDSGDFRLHGITFRGDEKKALIYSRKFSDKNKHRLVSEGETVEDEGSEIFTVATIDSDSVTLEYGGESLRIGLYDHERSSVEVAAHKGRSIVIGGRDEVTKVASRDEKEADEQDDRASSRSPDEPEPPPDRADRDDDADREEAEEDAQQESARGGLAELLDRMREARGQNSGEDSEQPSAGQAHEGRDTQESAEEGEMRRVDTPFGPVYRPVQSENGE